MKSRLIRTSFLLPVILLVALVADAQDNQRPVISHDPVKTAVRGQPVTILARVTDDSGYVKSATLFYSLSRDAAPFRSVMKSSGTSMYYGTIPASVLEGADSVSYYIEAMDHVDATQETPWYTLKVKDATAAPPAQAGQAPTQEPLPPPQEEGGVSWGTVGIIAGGAAAVVGGAVLLGSGGGGGGDDSGGGSGTVEVGDYDGSVTTCAQPEMGSQTCETHPMTINISEGGVVSSSTLYEGSQLQAPLQGSSFTLVQDLGDEAAGQTGQVQFDGTVIDSRIVGSISGELSAGSDIVTYSGTFSANKR